MPRTFPSIQAYNRAAVKAHLITPHPSGRAPLVDLSDIAAARTRFERALHTCPSEFALTTRGNINHVVQHQDALYSVKDPRFAGCVAVQQKGGLFLAQRAFLKKDV